MASDFGEILHLRMALAQIEGYAGICSEVDSAPGEAKAHFVWIRAKAAAALSYGKIKESSK